ncbi:TPA: hypothetical protein ACH3X1_002428 [Trebouxia sp. C0004]
MRRLHTLCAFLAAITSFEIQILGLPPPPPEEPWPGSPPAPVKNATDVVQDYLDELSNRGRQAARVGRPDIAAAQGDNAQSVTVAIHTVRMHLLQNPSLAEAAQGRLASLSLLRSATEAGPGCSSSVVQFMLLAVFGGGHSWPV